MPARTTRGMRMFQITDHCASDTPESMWTPGMWSRKASGMRHAGGPAGPIMAPSSTAATTTTIDAGNQASPRNRPPWWRGVPCCSTFMCRTSECPTIECGSSGGYSRGVRDGLAPGLDVVDDARPPPRGDVVVHRDHVPVDDSLHGAPAVAGGDRLGRLAAVLGARQEDQVG